MLSTPNRDAFMLASQFASRSNHVRLGIDISDCRPDRRRTRTERHRGCGDEHRLDSVRDRPDTCADILHFGPPATAVAGVTAGCGSIDLPGLVHPVVNPATFRV